MTDAVDSREQAGQDQHKEQCLMRTVDRLEEDALRTDDTDSSVGVFQLCNAVFAANRLVIGSGRQQARGLGHGWRHGSGRMCVPWLQHSRSDRAWDWLAEDPGEVDDSGGQVATEAAKPGS